LASQPIEIQGYDDLGFARQERERIQVRPGARDVQMLGATAARQSGGGNRHSEKSAPEEHRSS